jgi:hypothetical protein
MDGRASLGPARLLLTVAAEEYWRGAANRGYSALLHEGRVALERWGFPLSPREDIHRFVRLRLSVSVPADLNFVGDAVDWLARLRNEADYRLTGSRRFASAVDATQAVNRAQDAIDRLDAIHADPARRAAGIAAITAAWPTATGS